MSESATYSVVLSGNLKSGFEPQRVIEGFARLFKLSPEKASRIIGTEFVVKRDVELQVAKSYKEKLTNIGVEVLLKRDGGVEELALEPVQLPGAGDEVDKSPPGAEEMLCPKCALKQPKSDECRGCGVIIHKFLQLAAASEGATIISQEVEEPAPEDEKAFAMAAAGGMSVGVKAAIAVAGVAVLGALSWYLLAS